MRFKLLLHLIFLTLLSANVRAQTNQITLKVNMTGLTVSPNGVHVAGAFQDWNPASTPMIDEGDGIYSYTFTADEFANINFKFINGNDWPFQESVPSACGLPDGFGGFNRILETGGSDVVYGPYCFGECANCVPIIPIMVIFQVDMTNEEVGAEGVFVAGSFNNWDPTTTQLAANGDGTYSAVVFVDANSELSYKFINGTIWEIVPMECGVSDGFGGYNRTLSVASEAMNAELVCFNSCGTCVIVPTVSLTFNVDMSNEDVSSSGVHVAGSFNNFSPSSTPMTAQGNGIYSVTVEVPENLSVVYKYINGNDWSGAELVPFECGVNDGFGGYNRNIVTNNSDVTLPLVCFSSCEACILNVDEGQSSSGLLIYPNPANEVITVSGVQPNSNIAIFDVTGKMVLQSKTNTVYFTLNISELNRGIYILRDLSTSESARLLVK